jgi:uncharacterized SAM-binding protein YcdF (DUF218 family)
MSDLAPEGRSGVLVVLGKNWREKGTRLSVESRMNALAAAELSRRLDVEAVILSGGRTAGPEHPSEAALMLTYLQRHGPIPTRIVLEEQSIDTFDNAEHVRAILADRLHCAIYLATVDAHLPAAVTSFEANGLRPTAVYPSELLLLSRSPHHAAFVRRYRRSGRAILDRVRERIRMLILRFDRRGRSLRFLTKHLRG